MNFSQGLMVLGTTLLAVTGAAAEEVHRSLNLDQALAEGLSKNPQLQSSEAAKSEAGAKKKEAFGGFLPRLDLTAGHFFEIKYQQIQIAPTSVFETIYPKTNYGAQATWNLFDGLKTTYSYAASKAGQRASELEHEHTKMATENTIRLKYYQALGAQVLANVAEANVKTLTDHLKRAQDLLKQGEFTKVDVLKVQVQVETAVPESLAAQDAAFLARKALAEAMGVESDSRPLEGNLPVPAAEKIKGLSADNTTLAEGRLDLKALQEKVQATEDAYKASRATWMPRVNLIANYDYYNNRTFSMTETENFRNAYAVGVSLVWNLFDGGSSYARQESAYYQKLQLEHKARKMFLASVNEIEFWKRRYVNNAVLYSAKQRSVEASRESVRIYKNGLKAGTRTNSDLLDAELDLERAEAGVVKAQVDAVEALLNLELAMGRRI